MTTDDSYQERGSETPQTTTVTRMASPRGPISVTVGTVEAYLGGLKGVDIIGGGGGGGAGNALRRTIYVWLYRPILY